MLINHTVTTSSIPPNLSEPLSLQEKVANNLRETSNKIIKDVLTFLVASKNISVDAFIDKHVSKQTNSLTHLDQRTQLFAHILLDVIDEDLNKLPNLSQSFDILATYAKDPRIRQKFITATALNSIKELVLNLDTINPSIIDDINANYEKHNTTWKNKLSKIKKIELPKVSSHQWLRFSMPTLQKTLVIATCAILIFTYFSWCANLFIKPSYYNANSGIGKELIDFFLEGYEDKPRAKINILKTYENTYSQFNNCEKLPQYTFDMPLNIPYAMNIISNEFQEFLNIIDGLIIQECCCYISSNITFNFNSDNIKLKNRIKSNCEIITY
jgi:hypothetical protein